MTVMGHEITVDRKQKKCCNYGRPLILCYRTDLYVVMYLLQGHKIRCCDMHQISAKVVYSRRGLLHAHMPFFPVAAPLFHCLLDFPSAHVPDLSLQTAADSYHDAVADERLHGRNNGSHSSTDSKTVQKRKLDNDRSVTVPCSILLTTVLTLCCHCRSCIISPQLPWSTAHHKYQLTVVVVFIRLLCVCFCVPYSCSDH